MSKDNEIDKVEDELKKSLELMATNRRDDYEYARDLLHISSERLQDVLDAAVTLAQESEHPRAIEVATQTAVALGDVAGKMTDHHLKTEKLINPKGDKKEVVNNNVNVKLNTKDLLDLLGRE